MSRTLLVTVVGSSAVLLCAVSTWASGGDGDNGIEKKSPKEIAHLADQAFRSAQSVHLRIRDSGPAASSGDAVSALDFRLDREVNCTGSFTLGDKGSVQLVKRGDEVWVKPDVAYWKSQFPGGKGTRAANQMKNRYVHGKNDDPVLRELFGNTSRLCNLKGYQHISSRQHVLGVRKDGTTTVDGMRAVRLTGRDAHGTVLAEYVATRGKPYPIKLTEKGKDIDRIFLLADYDKPVPSATPSANQSVDASKLIWMLGQ
ncbi:hypothetical protein ACIBJF_52090 [Streptomyces sp. NPDC050743]|uniref:hypothetical protein n=1 Tax=Streptomyces sp. NPDC050743 TaxID=3365634 RepID=UPI0037A323A5